MNMSEHSVQIHKPGPLAASNSRGIKIKGAYKRQHLIKKTERTVLTSTQGEDKIDKYCVTYYFP